MKITVFGTGYVGLVSGTCFAELGNEVMCVDVDAKKIEGLQQGKIPIYEPGLEELVVRNAKEGRLKFTTDAREGIEFGEVIFSAVGTPPDKDHRADLTYVKEVAQTFGKYAKGYKIFVNKSTVPVGTAEICRDIIEKEIGQTGQDVQFDVVSNPEFLREGQAIKDTMTPDRIVVGVDSERAKEVMEKLYQSITRTGKPLVVTDIKSAEIIKYAANAFLATKISFINEIANFCELVGGNVREVSRGIGLDNRIGPRFLHAGIGYGGSCLPKDVEILIQSGKDNDYQFKILEAVEAVNKRQPELLLDKLFKHVPDIKGKRVAVWGLAFKPKTDDMRDAPAITMINKLLEAGAVVQVFDPVAMENARKIWGDRITYADNAYDAVNDATALLVLTEWDEFRSVDFTRIREKMKGDLVLDGRNVYDGRQFTGLNLKYISAGTN